VSTEHWAVADGRIWKPFIPEDERHIFERGAHFTREVIPDRLAVISLNTLFWFTSNSGE